MLIGPKRLFFVWNYVVYLQEHQVRHFKLTCGQVQELREELQEQLWWVILILGIDRSWALKFVTSGHVFLQIEDTTAHRYGIDYRRLL